MSHFICACSPSDSPSMYRDQPGTGAKMVTFSGAAKEECLGVAVATVTDRASEDEKRR